MAVITKRGRDLAANLNPVIGTTREILEACSIIARHAVTHNQLAEIECNGAMPWQVDTGGHWSDFQREWVEMRIKQVEKSILRAFNRLPDTDDGPLTLHLGGDPRGFTVSISAPGESRYLVTGRDWDDRVPA